MNKFIKTAAYILAGFVVLSCAKAVKTGPNEAEQRYFNAWMSQNHPGVQPTGLGIYILEEEDGTGATVKEDGFIYADYVTTDLEGNITSYTDKQTAKQLGKYDTTSFYGPKVMSTTEGTMPAGLAEALIGMKEGGRKKVIIPSWLMSHMSYETEEEYLASSSSSASTIYDITVRTYTDSIQLHEINLIEDYIKKNPQIFNSKMVNDTTGFYYQPLSENISTEKFEKDTTIYINYTGRLLNGLVFDTTIEKVAKDNGIYSSSRTYGPTEVNWGEKYDDLTLGSSKSTVIPGFALTLWHMHPMEKGMGVFYSPLGYSFNGSGSSIPGYAPLIFEIEIVAKPK
jgi:FKBP-type peptidyl-prolyl cis-trans isomerase FklB